MLNRFGRRSEQQVCDQCPKLIPIDVIFGAHPEPATDFLSTTKHLGAAD